MATTITPAFAELLQTAVTEPGILSSAYSQFHSYSLGNVLLAAVQCHGRRIPLGPMATYPRWKELGRHVKKGEKALTLCQPVTFKKPTRVIARYASRFRMSRSQKTSVNPAPTKGTATLTQKCFSD